MLAELVGYEDDETRSPTSFSSWVVHDSEEQTENQLKEKWTGEEMFKITHDKMRWLEFEYRFVEVES